MKFQRKTDVLTDRERLAQKIKEFLSSGESLEEAKELLRWTIRREDREERAA